MSDLEVRIKALDAAAKSGCDPEKLIKTAAEIAKFLKPTLQGDSH